MSENVTLNGLVYIIPDVGESGWGQNLTNYFVAIPAGVLQKSAGLFTLTADVDFGASFGVKSLYYKTETANGAAAGQVRLAHADTISFRNNANGGDIALGVNSSDQLTVAGAVVPTGSTPSFSSLTLTAVINQIVLGTTRTVTLTAPTPASSSRTWTIPDISSDATFMSREATETITGSKTFASGATLDIAQGTNLGFQDGSGHVIQLLGPSSTSNFQYILPATAPTDGQILSSTHLGTMSWITAAGTVNSGTAARLSLFATSTNAVSDTYVQNAHNITIAIAAQASRSADLAVTLPNPGNAVTTANILLDSDAGTYTIAGVWSFTNVITPTGGIKGVSTASSASAGNVGEVLESKQTSLTNFPTTNNYGDLVSKTLTAGEWMVYLFIDVTINGATITDDRFGLGTVTGNSATGLVNGDTAGHIGSAIAAVGAVSAALPAIHIELSGSTTYYFKYFAAYSGGPPQATGRMTAIRIS